ncbi:MAG TPA: CoA pyrophosphatase [Spongiibacteraceae bacterium]|nr:CoA pyrophosphatase [Spongiibacteraceae bacterium]
MASALLQRVQDALAPTSNEQNLCPAAETRRQAAVLLALTDEESPHLLMIRRGLNLPTHPGEIAFPGGKRDPEDTDLFATALREAWEEVALTSESVSYAGTLVPQISVTTLFVIPIVGVIQPDLPLRAHPGEVTEILYVPLAFFADPKNLRADRMLRAGDERISARFQFQHYTIWGLTGRFIVQLVNCLYNANLDIELRAQHALQRSRT